MSEQPNKSKTWLIIGVAVVVVVIGCCLIAVVLGAFMPKTDGLASVTQGPSGAVIRATEALVQPLQPTTPPEPTVAPQLGLDRSSPLPVGQSITSGPVTLQVGKVTRPADTIIAEANMFNVKPEPGNEFVMFDLTISCAATGDNKCNIGISIEFKMTGDKGLVYEPKTFIVDVPGLLESVEMFGGASQTGALVFEVGQGEGNLVLMYEPFISLDPSVYLLVQ